MASYNIHIAIGKRYLEKNSNITNFKDFYLALIEPDLTNNKEYTHYTIPNHHETLISHLEKKVGLYTL